MNSIQISEHITVGPQPSKDELKQLARDGFRTVINLRVEHEEDEMMSPIDEADLVRGEGLTYLHLPVSMKQVLPGQVDEFRNAVEQLDQPIFVHCKSAKRAGAFAMMHEALRHGWSGDETMKKAGEMGFECDKPELVEFVKEYIDSHASTS